MKEEHIQELEKLLGIDIDKLDDEIRQHPDVYYRVSKAYSEAIAERDRLKDYLNQVKSAVELRIREEMVAKNIRDTDSKVEASVAVDDSYIEAQEEFREAQHFASRLDNLKRALEQRSHMLRDLVQLYCANWFSDRAAYVHDARA